VFGLCLSLLASSAFAAEGVEVGDKAPAFTLKDDQGKDWKSADHFGKKIVVIYFYPADMTGGCTKQACGFRDDMSKLQSKNVEVVGISGDSVRNHQLFKQVHDLNFALLADTKGEVAKKLGVPYTPGEKSIIREIAGKEETLVRGVTTQRWTIVVGTDGLIKLKRKTTDAAGDSQFILDNLADLQS
jgi:peroxiredoxin Q/BCP